ncbi:MAG: tRNA pseudouridine(38-40) synthase TruA, partial [Pedobacter sp.]
FFHIAYQGQYFSGWQKQPGVKSVQEVIEQTLSKILKSPITINGCGRTDAHVHASQFFFHADIEKIIAFDLLYIVNKALPYNIAVFDIIEMEGKPHARFDAVQRKYDYFVHTYKDPFLSTQSSFYQVDNLFRFHIASNRFLGKMIRITMGKILMVGKNELSVEEFENDLITLQASKLTLPAHPTGLYLSKVTYPYLNLEPRTEFINVAQGAEWISV